MIKIIEVKNNPEYFKDVFSDCMTIISEKIKEFPAINTEIVKVNTTYLLDSVQSVLIKEIFENYLECTETNIVQVNSGEISHKIIIPNTDRTVLTITININGNNNVITISTDIINLSFEIVIYENDNYCTINLTKKQCINLLKILDTYDEVYNEKSNMPTSKFMRDKLPPEIKNIGKVILEEEEEVDSPIGTLPDSSVWNLRNRK